MCPFCISAAAVAIAGTGSAGGLAAAVAARLHIRRHERAGHSVRSADRKTDHRQAIDPPSDNQEVHHEK